jgi:hypothetical protein
MEDMAMRITKERNIIFISGGQLGICQGRGIFMDAFFLKLNEYFPIGDLHDSICS